MSFFLLPEENKNGIISLGFKFSNSRKGFPSFLTRTMKAIIIISFGLVILFIIHPSTSENILFLSFPYFGHMNPMTGLARELYKRGHNSYFPVTPNLMKTLKLAEGSHFIHRNDDPEIEKFNKMGMKLFSPNSEGAWNDLLDSLGKICDNLLFDEKWFEKLRAVNASLAIVDVVFMSRCLTIIPYKLSIPYILMGAENSPAIHRTPWSYASFPFIISTHSERMSLKEKMLNSLFLISEYLSPPMGTPRKSIKAYAPNKPEITYNKLLGDSQLNIIESDVLLNYPLPSLPNVEYLGGMGTRPANPLEGDLLRFVNASKTGIIVVSFGSVVNSLPKEHLDKMAEAFKKIKYDVVWKFLNTSHSAANVFLTKWMPQNDLLGHPKTKLFITHCGNGGQFEALYHGVPMLGFPVFGDQPYNGKRMEYRGYGISMNLYNYKMEDLVENINEIIDNPKYKRNIKRASDIFKSRPEHPSVRGARIVDDVIKYGGGFLRSYCQDMPLYEYFMLDILAVVLSSAFIAISIIIFILRKCLSFCYKKKEKKE